jgi:hypothetical protein
MKPTEMHALAHRGCHDCAPKAWHNVPKVTGDYDLDATIMHRKNKDMAARLNMYLATPRVVAGAYGPRSGYTHQGGYHGDD